MSVSREFQEAIYNRLISDAAVGALIGNRVYDDSPANREFPCITFGPTDVVPNDMECITARTETIQLDVWSRDHGRKWPCKEIMDAVKGALHLVDIELAVNALVVIRVVGQRVFMDRDGITAHGVVTVSAELEEN